MKNNLLKGILFVALAGLITFTGCKYEEGPGISLRSKRDRFANEWIVKSYMRDTANLSDIFTDSNNFDLGNLAFVTSRNGRFEFHHMPDSPYTIAGGNWNHPTYLQMKELTDKLSEALGMATAFTNDTNEYNAPKGKWIFDEKSSSVQMEQLDLSHIDTIPNRTYEILELREDALMLKWTAEDKTVRKIGFEPINDEDFFL